MYTKTSALRAFHTCVRLVNTPHPPLTPGHGEAAIECNYHFVETLRSVNAFSEALAASVSNLVISEYALRVCVVI